MAFHHRKLLNDSLPAPSPICVKPCNIFLNPNGDCPQTCLSLCPDVCKSSIILYPSPPPPPSQSLPPLFSPPDPDKPRQLSLVLIASLAVLATAFFLFTCYTIYKFYTVWRSSSRRRRPPLHRRHPEEDDNGDFLDEDHGPVVDHPIWYIRTIGLQPSVINAITIVNYKKGDGLVEGTDCAVCLSEFQEDETLRLLPKCNHAFHIPCIDTWLGSHTNCPMCRAGVVSATAGPQPSQEAVAHESGRVEEARSESIRIGMEDERVETNENVEGGDCKVDIGGLDGVRRSVSMDSVSAAMISAAVANAFPQQCDRNSGKAKEIRVGVNESHVSMQTGSSSIKRSASCSANVYLSRHSSRR